MIIVQLTRIKFRNRPDVQTVTYTKRIPEWMAQWTVGNNFPPALSAGNDTQAIERQWADLFWSHMQSALPELCKRGKLDHLADFEFRFTQQVCEPDKLARYVGSGSFIGSDPFGGDGEPDEPAPEAPKTESKTEANIRSRILSLVRKHFPDGNLYEQFRHHKYSLKALCDEQGMDDVTNLLSDFAAVFEVGGSEVLDMDLDQMVEYIISLSHDF